MADLSSLGVYGGYYMQQQAETETAMLKSLAPIEVAQAGAKLQETQLEVQQKTFDLRNAESLYARQQRMLSQMDASQATNPGGIAGQVNSEADAAATRMFKEAAIYRQNGFYKEADETDAKATTILENNSKIQTRNANQQAKMLGDVRNLLDAVHNENDWDNLRAQFPVLHPDEAKLPDVQKILQMKYPGPAAVRAMSDSLTSQKERAQTASALADARARTAVANKDDEYTKNYLPKLEKLADARANAISKAGGGKVSGSDVSQMTKMIEAAYPNADPNQAATLARHLAQDAAVLQARGMSKADAQDRAFKNAGRSYFAGIRRSRDLPGSTPDKPLSLPESQDQMKDGMYYMTPKNGLQVWDAKAGGFLAPSPEAIRAQDEETDQLPVDLDGSERDE